MSILDVETAMTDEQKAMLLTILINPGDHTPILVYCDWMQENNLEDNAQDIRDVLESEYLGFEQWFKIKQLLRLETDEARNEFDVCPFNDDEDACKDARNIWATHSVCLYYNQGVISENNKYKLREDEIREEIEHWLKVYLEHKEIQRARED